MNREKFIPVANHDWRHGAIKAIYLRERTPWREVNANLFRTNKPLQPEG